MDTECQKWVMDVLLKVDFFVSVYDNEYQR